MSLLVSPVAGVVSGMWWDLVYACDVSSLNNLATVPGDRFCLPLFIDSEEHGTGVLVCFDQGHQMMAPGVKPESD